MPARRKAHAKSLADGGSTSRSALHGRLLFSAGADQAVVSVADVSLDVALERSFLPPLRPMGNPSRTSRSNGRP